MKAEFTGKYRTKFSDCVYLVYKYRNMYYTICENNTKGNEPLAWQHKAEQDRIDRILDTPQQAGQAVNMDEIYEMMGWNE